MTAYYKKVASQGNPVFQNKEIVVASVSGSGDGYGRVERIPIPDDVVVCNGCNKSCFPEPVFMMYLSKADLKNGHAYDCYCEKCLKSYFPKAVEVKEE